jgi:uncharacterized radical SAM superfamily Fe-S cluster-containing enzyme
MKSEFIESSYGLCPDCGQILTMKLFCRDEDVFADKFCAKCQTHSTALISGSAEDYFNRREVVKPALIPNAFAGDNTKPCPQGCGFCSRHEQHLCMPIVEITHRCNMRCPICLNSSGINDVPDMTITEFSFVIDKLIETEEQIDILNISGGEPLLHPELLSMIDLALAEEKIVRVSISTNGLALLEHPKIVKELKKRDVVISLQFDGFDDSANTKMRGREMAVSRHKILALLRSHNLYMSLVFTLCEWNSQALESTLKILQDYDNVLSLMIQPLSFTGRAADLQTQRITMDIALTLLDRFGAPIVKSADFAALPCSHPACFSLAYYLKLAPGRLIPLNRLIDEKTLLSNAANKVVFGLNASEHEELKDLVYRIWAENSNEADEICAVLKRLLKNYQASDCACKCFNPRRAFNLMEREIKSIYIHAFMDRGNFELSRVRRCCQTYAQGDGRFIPCCVRNNVQGAGL